MTKTETALEIYSIPRIFTPGYCDSLINHQPTISHHTDEEGHGYAPKQLFLDEACALIWQAIKNTPISRKSIGVDPYMKLYKLAAPTGKVAPHKDEDYVNDNGLLAAYSVIMYLNDDYTGGETLFEGMVAPKHRKGAGLLFKHDILHEGLAVKSGVKYVLKTDLFVD